MQGGATGLRYVYRPVLLASCGTASHGGGTEAGACDGLGAEGPLVLPGFGVEAVLKNMEYSAMDDKKVKAEQQEAQGVGRGVGEGCGGGRVSG